MKSILISLLLFSMSALGQTQWQPIAPGLDYSRIANFADYPAGSIHAFKIDPSLYEFQLNSQSGTQIQQQMQQQHAILAVNGGFFTPDNKPLGLRISQGQVLNPLRQISWWGIFSITNSIAQISSKKEFRPNPAINFAIQAGPRLVVNGKIPNLTPGVDSRTALGITRDGKVILLVTDQFFVSTEQLGEIMRSSEADDGLNCINAINLDGGHSTQLYTRLPNLNLQRNSLFQVADLIFIIPKNDSR